MALMSKVAVLVLSGAAMLNIHATPVAVSAQVAVQYQQAASMPAPAAGRTIARPAARTTAPVPVPEPIHYKLMLLGLAMLLLFGRRGAGRHKPWTKN